MIKCSILVSSCDKYEEIWNPFFILLRKYWPNCTFPCYIFTESKKCNCDGVETILTSGFWSDRLLTALDSVKTEYVLLMLDDFFLMKEVNDIEVNRVIEILDTHTEIAVFYFKHSTPQTSKDIKFGRYIKMDKTKKYAVNFQAAIWRVTALKEIIAPGKSPWDIEEKLPPNVSPTWDFYCQEESSYTDCKNDVIPYLWALQAGYGVCKGRLLWNNKKLFDREGIDFKPKQLQVMTHREYLISKIKDKINSYMGKR